MHLGYIWARKSKHRRSSSMGMVTRHRRCRRSCRILATGNRRHEPSFRLEERNHLPRLDRTFLHLLRQLSLLLASPILQLDRRRRRRRNPLPRFAISRRVVGQQPLPPVSSPIDFPPSFLLLYPVPSTTRQPTRSPSLPLSSLLPSNLLLHHRRPSSRYEKEDGRIRTLRSCRRGRCEVRRDHYRLAD